MSYHKIPAELMASVNIPPPSLSKLSFCGSSKLAKVELWADGLQATQISRTSVMLYKALPEVHQLKTNPENRLAILETLRTTTQNAINGLTKEFLYSPLSISETAQKQAIIAQSLQKSMIDGYTQCAKELSAQKRLTPLTLDALAQVIHRSITGISLLFLRSYQLYTQPPTGLWKRAHTLFQVAEYFDLLAKPIADTQLSTSRASNIQCAYTRLLIMGTSKLNQVSKNEVAQAYDVFENWSLFVKLAPQISEDKENFFIANLDSDAAPLYKSQVSDTENGRFIEINFKALLASLSKHSSDASETLNSVGMVKIPAQLSNALLDHLIQCWSGISLRQQERKHVEGTADVCVGLVDCHQFVSGGLTFEEYNRMGELESDSFENSIPLGFTPAENKPSHEKVKPTYRVTIQNISAGGYCLLWKSDIPNRLQAGEVLAVKAMGKRIWALGVVRWVRHLKNASQMGVQILVEQPTAAAIAQVYDMGGYSDYMRAFIIKPQKGSNMPISLITANAPFKEYDKVKLFNGDQVINAKLDKSLFATANITQFAYRPMESDKPAAVQKKTNAAATPTTKQPGDSFDDSWD